LPEPASEPPPQSARRGSTLGRAGPLLPSSLVEVLAFPGRNKGSRSYLHPLGAACPISPYKAGMPPTVPPKEKAGGPAKDATRVKTIPGKKPATHATGSTSKKRDVKQTAAPKVCMFQLAPRLGFATDPTTWCPNALVRASVPKQSWAYIMSLAV